MKKIIIAGAGNAGLMTALIIKKTLPNTDITIIHDTATGIVGVGEGSTEHFSLLMDLMGWSPEDIWNNCGATYKFGIVFYDWIKDLDPNVWIQSVFINNFFPSSITTFTDFFELVAQGKNPVQVLRLEDTIHDGVAPFEYNIEKGIGDFLLPNQFHFDTFKLNQFLTDVCIYYGIKIEEHKITDVVLEEAGWDHSEEKIKYIRTDNEQEIRADLFVDCTGFAKTLISKFSDYEWKDLSHEFLTNRAITWQTETDFSKIIAFTKATALDHGWVWTIPTQTHIGYGYVFSDNHVSLDRAVEEVEEKFQVSDIGRDIKFDSGYCTKAWIGNTVAIGLSSSFCEPIEATNIATIIQQARILTTHLSTIDNDYSFQLKSYNKIFGHLMDNLFDFVRLHYYGNKNDSQFWVDNQNIKMNDHISFLHECCTKGGTPDKALIETGGTTILENVYNLFTQKNYLLNLYAIGWWGKSNAVELLKDIHFEINKITGSKVDENLQQMIGASMVGLKNIMEVRQKYNIKSKMRQL